MDKKIMGGMILVLFLAGCVNSPPNPGGLVSMETKTLFEAWAEKQGMDSNAAHAFLKNTYGLTNENQVFEKLPPIPADFNAAKKLLYDGQAPPLADIPYEVYARPEFYPNFDQWKSTWVEHPANKTYSLGIMVTPAEQHAILARDATEFETTLFVGTAWDVTEYQGIALRAVVSPEAPIEVSIEPSDLLLGPTFPTFDPEWMQKVRVHGRVTGVVTPGIYTITLLRGAPRAESIADWETRDINIAVGDSVFANPEGLATLTLIRERGD